MTTLERKIVEALEKAPNGLKGREIAQRIHEDKTLVNSTLYHKLRDKCRQDPNTYKWYLKKSTKTQSCNRTKPKSKTKTSPQRTVVRSSSTSRCYSYGISSSGPKLSNSNIPSLNSGTIPLDSREKKTNTDAFRGRVMEFDRDGLLISMR